MDAENQARAERRASEFTKRKMKLHLARERGYGDIKPLWNAILTLRRGKFTFEEIAIVLETDIDTILFEWDRIKQNAQ